MLIALDAHEDLYENFWDYRSDRMKLTSHGFVTGSAGRQEMIWEQAIMIFSMYTLWFALDDGDPVKTDITDKLTSQWEFYKKNFTHEQLTANFGRTPNIAVDDSGWGAMTYMIMHHITGDPYAAQVCKELVRGAYEHWKDTDTANGLWYPHIPPSQGGGPETRFKSMSSVGLMYAALEYTSATGDFALFEDTLKVYEWTESNMLRNRTVTYENGLSDGGSYTISVTDNLYWMDFNDNRDGRFEKLGPDGGTRPGDIREAGSVSCMFANTAMGAIHALMHEITGEDEYLIRALETLRAFNDSPYYSHEGVYVNDRDAWANAMFIGPWVRRVLSLPEATDYDRQRIYETASSIFRHCRTEEGYWKAGWSGGAAWDPHISETQIMTSATTVNMLTAAALMEKMEATG